MTEYLFVSDIHLSAERPATVALFLGFLRERAPQAEKLYILGDLFDGWVGDDDTRPPAPEIAAGLRALSETGTEVLLMHGNRDFLLGQAFAASAGCRLLDDPTLVELHGTATLLTHGDTLCTDDVDYQHFRASVRNDGFAREFLARSLPERIALVADYRRRSGEAMSLKPEDIMDVNANAVAGLMRRHGVRRLIHGHTHRPGRFRVALNGESAERLVLPQWDKGTAGFLRCTGSRCHAERLDSPP